MRRFPGIATLPRYATRSPEPKAGRADLRRVLDRRRERRRSSRSGLLELQPSEPLLGFASMAQSLSRLNIGVCCVLPLSPGYRWDVRLWPKADTLVSECRGSFRGYSGRHKMQSSWQLMTVRVTSIDRGSCRVLRARSYRRAWPLARRLRRWSQ